jgi:hypothetical protein
VSRGLDIALRSSLLLALSVGLLVLPFAAGLGAAAVAAGVSAGALAFTVGVAGTGNGGRGTLSASAHAAFDRALGGGLLIAALAFGVAGERGALVVFGAIGLTVLAIAAATRYAASTASP